MDTFFFGRLTWAFKEIKYMWPKHVPTTKSHLILRYVVFCVVYEYLTIILRGSAGYEGVDNQRGA